jgi:hypothetical protein
MNKCYAIVAVGYIIMSGSKVVLLLGNSDVKRKACWMKPSRQTDGLFLVIFWQEMNEASIESNE